MTTKYITGPTLSFLRVRLLFLPIPRPKVFWRVFDNLDAAIGSLEPVAEYKRRSVIARFHDKSKPKLQFILLFKE